MSSPSNSLRKTKRSPLPGNTKVPFRHYYDFSTSESPLPDHTYDIDSCTHKAIINELQHDVERGNSYTTTNDDSELLVSMARRLGMVEKELILSKREIVEKNEYICRLEARVSALEASGQRKSKGCSEDDVRQLERQCQALQKQVDEMEEFLNDYGMVWVGESHPSYQTGGLWSPSSSIRQSPGQPGVESGQPSGVWSPDRSLSQQQEDVNYDRIIKNIRELNILAGEGSSTVTKTPEGAKLKVLEPVPIILYKNGLAMFSGPFRPYSDPATQQVIRDLTEGYFPSELQSRFPEGVPLAVTDQRDVIFRQRSTYFSGSGHLLGGEKGPSRLLPAGSVLRTPPKSSGLKEVWELPGKKLSMDQFLSKMPQSVVRKGRVLDIRAGIKDTLQGGGSVPKLMLVETEVLEELKNRLDFTEDLRPPTPSHLITLRIKDEKGDQTYVLKMKHTETIADVRKYINKLRSKGSPCDYLLKTTFPTRTLDNPAATLEQCGLAPTATLHMANRTI